VIDRGPGIPEADREQAFAPFQRRDDLSTGDSAGVGLGLAIARGFTKAMGGTLTMDDTPGGGLTAVVSLPAANPRPSPDAASGSRPDNPDRPWSPGDNGHGAFRARGGGA
jgi:two-component system sensor histidine kinase KdpD